MLERHGFNPAEVGPASVDAHAQVAMLQRADPHHPALPALQGALNGGKIGAARKMLGELTSGPNVSKWVVTLMGIAAIAALWWWYSREQKKRTRRRTRTPWRRNDRTFQRENIDDDWVGDHDTEDDDE